MESCEEAKIERWPVGVELPITMYMMFKGMYVTLRGDREGVDRVRVRGNGKVKDGSRMIRRLTVAVKR